MENRQNLTRFALEALRKLPRARTYALTDEAKTGLAVLAAALKKDRERRNLTDDDEPTAQSQMVALLERLPKAGVNLTQQRPEAESKPLPALWTHPLTGQPLGVPKTPDERAALAKADPDLLALLDELETRPYAVTLKLRQDEEKRKMLAAVPYSGAEHLANPFRTGNKKLQDEIVRRGPPELVRFYQREAADIALPIFGPTRNLTIEGRIAKDSETLELIKAAQRIHEEWQAQDRATAQQQRDAAEATLKKLQAA